MDYFRPRIRNPFPNRNSRNSRSTSPPDLVIDACPWHVDAEAAPYKQRALDHFRDRYTVLLDFLRARGVARRPVGGSGRIGLAGVPTATVPPDRRGVRAGAPMPWHVEPGVRAGPHATA